MESSICFLIDIIVYDNLIKKIVEQPAYQQLQNIMAQSSL